MGRTLRGVGCVLDVVRRAAEAKQEPEPAVLSILAQGLKKLRTV